MVIVAWTAATLGSFQGSSDLLYAQTLIMSALTACERLGRRGTGAGILVVFFRLVLLLTGGALLMGCEPLGLGNESDGNVDRLTSPTWKLTSIRTPEGDTLSLKDVITRTSDRDSYTVQFTGDGSLGGVGDCNHYGGAYQVVGDGEIAVELRFRTEAGCAETSRETLFFEAVSQAEEYDVIDGDDLRLRYAEGEEMGVLLFERRE